MPKCQLNDDIWHHVLSFLSPEDLQQANSCHHVLFEGWMRYRYTAVKFAHRDEAIRLLERLCDSNVAAYVKKVEIRPWLVQTPAHNNGSSARFSHLLQPYHTRKSAKERLQRRVNEDVSCLKAAFKQMQNITEYTIDWDSSFHYHAELYLACLMSGLDAWSDNLVKLTVKVPPSMLNSFAGINLPKLESFDWQFCTGTLSLKEIDMATDGFMVFLNNLKDSLQSLHVSSTHSSQNLDMSRIFCKMGRFPSLSKISLSIPANGGHLSDPATVVRFLEKHRSTLEDISLLFSQFPCGGELDSFGSIIDQRTNILRSATSTSVQLSRPPLRIFGRFMDQPHLRLKDIRLFSARATSRSKGGDNDFTNWTLRLAEYINTPFPRLRGINISLFPSGAPVDNLIKLINTYSPTLDSLTLTDCTLSYSDVMALFQPSASRTDPLLHISKLHLRVDRFSSEFLVDLAFLLPSLKTLRMECNSALDVTERSLTHEVLCSGWGLQHLEILTHDQHPDGVQTLIIDLSEEAPDLFPVRSDSRAKKGSVCSLSSYVTAMDAMPSPGSKSSSSLEICSMMSDISVCSVASSRTNDTDYGLFYTRRAFSQASNDWDGRSWRLCDHTAMRRAS